MLTIWNLNTKYLYIKHNLSCIVFQIIQIIKKVIIYFGKLIENIQEQITNHDKNSVSPLGADNSKLNIEYMINLKKKKVKYR